VTRLLNAWRALDAEQRLTAGVALALFVSMLLPWYSKTDTVVVRNTAKATEQSLSAFQAFSFVEAAVLLVSAGVLAMLFSRAEGRDFHLPGGDGAIVMLAGGWSSLLIFYRLLDKPGLQGNDRVTSAVGVQWGIFIALLLALGLLYSGRRIRAGEHAQPPLARSRVRPAPSAPRPRSPSGADAAPRGRESDPDRDETVVISTPERSTPRPAASRARPRFPPSPAEQMSFEDAPPHED
jgi:hypothetical protein